MKKILALQKERKYFAYLSIYQISKLRSFVNRVSGDDVQLFKFFFKTIESPYLSMNNKWFVCNIQQKYVKIRTVWVGCLPCRGRFRATGPLYAVSSSYLRSLCPSSQQEGCKGEGQSESRSDDPCIPFMRNEVKLSGVFVRLRQLSAGRLFRDK